LIIAIDTTFALQNYCNGREMPKKLKRKRKPKRKEEFEDKKDKPYV